MLLVKTFVASSKTQGQGLFSSQNIKKGTVTWRFDPNIDKEYAIDEFEKLPDQEKNYVQHHAVLSKLSNKYILSTDNAQFTNHSSNPNLETLEEDGQVELIARAKRDIHEGEEMTIDYRLMDKNDEYSDEEYLK